MSFQLLQLRAKSVTPLAAGATYTTGAQKATMAVGRIIGLVFADQPGTLIVEQSIDDGAHFDVASTFTISAGTGLGFSVELVAPTWQLRVVNGATPQGVMRVGVSQRAV